MGTTAGPGKQDTRAVVAMELRTGLAIQELGWDSDVDESLRDAIMDAVDGDLVDGLVDSLRDLSDTGHIWLMTPKVGRPGYVDPADIAEGAITAGLALANVVKVSKDWHAQKVVRPKASRK